ncbi:ATP-binding protein [Bacteroidota bacterium]
MSKNKFHIEKELTIRSSTDNLSSVRDFTKGATEEIGVDQKSAGKIILAVDEACTNIIKHAYEYSRGGKIHIKIKADNKKFSITIIDDGIHFNPDLVPEPNLMILQKEKRGGGLGMFLMRKLMDEINYTNISPNRNKVVLVKYLTPN